MESYCPKCTYCNVNGRIYCDMCRICVAMKKSRNQSSQSPLKESRFEGPESPDTYDKTISENSEGPSSDVAEHSPASSENEVQSHTDESESSNDMNEDAPLLITSDDNVDPSRKDTTSYNSTLNVQSKEPSAVVDEQSTVNLETRDHHADECSSNTENDSYNSKEIRLVLIGRTGAGKSATGNTILKEKIFFSKSSSCSVTKECVRGASYEMGHHVQVIDTPGMFDTEMSISDITREVVRCVTMTAPGPHAFIVVIKPDRFTEEEQKTIAHFKGLFGESMQKYMIVLFTKKDQLAADESSVEEYIENGNPKLKELLQSCDNRYVTFNNRGTEDEKERDVQKLLTMVLSMVEQNKGVYTNEMFEEAEKHLKEQEQKLEREHQEQMEQEIARIVAERDSAMEQLKDLHKEEIQALQARIVVLEKHNLEEGLEAQETEDLDHLYEEIKRRKDRLEEQMRRIEEAANASIQETKRPPNFRERLREKAAKGGKFFIKNILPVLKWVTDTIVPLVTALVKS